jgi:hypothetical protein
MFHVEQLFGRYKTDETRKRPRGSGHIKRAQKSIRVGKPFYLYISMTYKK